MSEAITGVLKLTVGFISNKLRTYAAEKLQDGGLTDQMFRGCIVSELEDIQSKLDAMSRKDLCTSISYLRQGIQRLNMSVGELSESGDRNGSPSTSELQNAAQLSSTSLTQPTPQPGTVENAVALLNAIGKLKIESSERFESAKEYFKDAGKEATQAFHNSALSTEERILASKVRFASEILKHLEDPELAARDCLQYLNEMHDMPAIKETFLVYIEGGIKSLFKRDSRAEIVETVTMMNLIVADFISTFTKQRMAVFDWPTIVCGKRVVHPIHFKDERLPNLSEIYVTPPWDIVELEDDVLLNDIYIRNNAALNRKGDLVCFTKDKGPQKLVKRTGNLQPYCPSALEDNTEHPKSVDGGVAVECVAVWCSEDDTVYVLTKPKDDGYRLSVYSADGRNTHQSALKFLSSYSSASIVGIAITNDKNIVILVGLSDFIPIYSRVYVCNKNGELINSFNPAHGPGLTYLVTMSMSVSSNNEIVLVTRKIIDLFRGFYRLFSYTEDGKFQRTVTEFRTGENGSSYKDILYNDGTKTIIRYVQGCIEYLSGETGELQRSHLLHDTNFPEIASNFHLVWHTNGTLALVGKRNVIFLKKT